jgi:predicted adenylyl cyclase CyaB
VREFSDGSGELIAYERPDQTGPKQSIYSRCPCGRARSLVEILRRILPLRGAVIKERDVFLVGRTRIHLDRVVDLGDFMELEVVLKDGEPLEAGEREAHELLRALDVPEDALVSHAYIDLLEKRRRQD